MDKAMEQINSYQAQPEPIRRAINEPNDPDIALEVGRRWLCLALLRLGLASHAPTLARLCVHALCGRRSRRCCRM